MIKKTFLPLFAFIFLFGFCNRSTETTDSDVADTTDTASTLLVPDTLPWSQKLAETLMVKYPGFFDMEGRTEPKWSYTYGLVSLAYLKLWETTGDKRYYDYAKIYPDNLIGENGAIKTYKMSDYNIDKINSGKILFYFYKETKDERYKSAMDTLRKQLEGHPRTQTGGFWHKKRYPFQIWLDGLYMGAPFYAQYGKEFNQPEDIDDVVKWILLIEEKARDEKTGLLYHAWNEDKKQKWANPETGCSPHFWGRGMGWYAMAVVDALDFIPEDHPKRNDVIAVFQRLAEAVVKVQDAETGCWHQVMDMGDKEGNYLEGSVTCMLTYSVLKAIKMEYIDKSYLESAKKAYNGITKHLMRVEEDGTVWITPVCAVAGLGGNPYRDGSYEYYINERKKDNDPKATGPFIMAGIIMSELE